MSSVGSAGPEHGKQPESNSDLERQQSDTDNNALNTNVLEEPLHPLGQIPRCFEDVPLSDEDTNDLENTDTTFNSLGLCRLYPRRPSFEPDKFVVSSLLSTTCPTALQETDSGILPPPYPFPNMSVYRLMAWMNSGSNKKLETEVARLVKEVMLAEDFDLKHLEDFSVRSNDWIQASVTIKIPTKSKEDDARSFSVPGFHFRPLIEVIWSAFTDIQASAFHLSPFRRLWKDPLDNHQERVFDELYTSDSWLDAQDDLQKLPREPGCKLERVIAGLMFFSDATHLANFGTAKAWPLYMYFGNLTKYACSAPKSGACHLVGFLPSLPDKVKDVLSGLPRMSKSGMAALQTHCRRELFHACWDTLLDQDFVHAYRHGIVLKCADGVLRRIFPRIFTYSADYPEKVLIATIKDMGSCPCPRCLTPKNMFSSLGLLKDMKSRVTNIRIYVLAKIIKAREYIYNWGNTVDGVKVDETLGEGSWVPILNTFVEKLRALGLDPFHMLVVDFMHECELGTWKALFKHLVRILYALPGGNQLIATLDARFRLVPTFGDGCVIPVFEGLFPASHDKIIQSLLYRFAQWHALAKLRIHSDSTLCFLEETFKKLSKQLWNFRDFTCAVFNTVELPRERAARQQKLVQRIGPNGIASEPSGPRVKRFNLSTYKFHAMGDYVRTIKLFGTTDSFTTQIGELVHRALKAFYPLTSKVDTPAQLAKHERRWRVLRRVAEAAGVPSSNIQSPADSPAPSISQDHHFIVISRNVPVPLFAFLREHDGDTATKNFIPKLKDHILYRLKKLDVSRCDHIFTDKEHNLVIIPNNTIYSVQTMQVHYTTYDMRRGYDTINPRTHADVMVLSGETSPSHPYWYARILGIYHMDTWPKGDGSAREQHLEVLHVRWLAPLISSGYQSGIQCARLPKVVFVEESDYDTFRFLDPGQVIRGAHLIPVFASERGVTSLRHGKSLGHAQDKLDDWEAFYVGIFADRDMFLRHMHLGVGHPVALWRVVRDCLGLRSTTTVNSGGMDVDQGRDNVNSATTEEGDETVQTDAYHDIAEGLNTSTSGVNTTRSTSLQDKNIANMRTVEAAASLFGSDGDSGPDPFAVIGSKETDTTPPAGFDGT
ncbi:hypothetical protein EV702DRAFT_1214493 [Suillus placidus]|uniref:Uncharacterized protein n=1 Tax=Suillus placidus TaxID=48579 RepID=A0A9P7D4Q0_9AGAM|nr:hypothetical protein EV702DRAFT_1214493 [Suillus placidus]